MSGLLSHRMFVVLLIGVLAVAGDACAQTTWYVDDDAPGDPGAGDPTVSDPNEDGSADHPFDAIQEGINAAVDGDTVLVLDGEYTGAGNRSLNFGGRLITVRSANGAASCVIDCQHLGRGFYFGSGETAEAVVEGFTIANGRADWGGGMFNRDSSPTVTRCTFSANTTEWADGGGMINVRSSPTVTDCTFSGNMADWGGGMFNLESSPTVTQCTFSGNEADLGGGMYNWDSSPTVTHCILWDDTPEEIYNRPSLPGAPTVTYSDVQGGYAGKGNINADPLFVDADGPDDTLGTQDDNLRLSGCSPCIDAGDNAAVPPGLTTDLDGNPRIFHGTVDMGAYERQDGDGSPDGCPPAAQDCCGATGPVAPLGLAVGMLLLSRFTGYRSARRR